jgi:hypothetical protein
MSHAYRGNPLSGHFRLVMWLDSCQLKSRDGPSALYADAEAWNPMEHTGFHVNIAAIAPTDHSSSVESY